MVALVLNANEAERPRSQKGLSDTSRTNIPDTTIPVSSEQDTASPLPENRPNRRSLLVRKPQGFSAEDGNTVTATGGVTAVPNTGNIQKVRAPLLGKDTSNLATAASEPTSEEIAVKPAADIGSSVLEKLQLPGVKARTSRFRRVHKSENTARTRVNTENPEIVSRNSNKAKGFRQWARAGWIPTQEGAWAMALIPYWVGVIESSLLWIHWLVFALWIFGYFAFNVGGIWLRSRRKDRYLLPLQVYGSITLVLGIISVLLAPPLLEWALVFFPLILIAVTESVRHRERSFLARTSTILATGVMSLVAYDIGTQFSRSFAAISWLEHTGTANIDWVVSPTGTLQGWGWMLIVSWAITSYYWVTIPYVRSLVRARGSQTFLAFSVGVHAVLTAVILAFFILGWVTFWHLLVWLGLFARSLAVPLIQQRFPQTVTISRIGFIEVAVAMLVIITLLF